MLVTTSFSSFCWYRANPQTRQRVTQVSPVLRRDPATQVVRMKVQMLKCRQIAQLADGIDPAQLVVSRAASRVKFAQIPQLRPGFVPVNCIVVEPACACSLLKFPSCGRYTARQAVAVQVQGTQIGHVAPTAAECVPVKSFLSSHRRRQSGEFAQAPTESMPVNPLSCAGTDHSESAVHVSIKPRRDAPRTGCCSAASATSG